MKEDVEDARHGAREKKEFRSHRLDTKQTYREFD